MTIIEQIKAEIERLKNEHPVGKYDESYDAGVDAGYFYCCNELLQSLSTLGGKSARQRLAEWSKTPEGRESYEKVASEMRREISEKPMNQDELEKEINRFRTIFQYECDPRVINEVARHFAQWGAEHLKR